MYSFYDLGNLSYSFKSLTNTSVFYGYGFGFGLILPYTRALRIEYSTNYNNISSISFKLGLPF